MFSLISVFSPCLLPICNHVISSDVGVDAEQAAWAAVDLALAATPENAPTKVFRELEGVDAAVGVACRGLIGVLLQVTLRGHPKLGTTQKTL